MSKNNIEEYLKKINKKIENEVNGPVSFKELFDIGFMDRNSEFQNIEQFFLHYNFKVNTKDDLNNLNEEQLNEAVRLSTKFASWDEMYKNATNEYLIKKLKKAGFKIG
jgi:hypothetical protein